MLLCKHPHYTWSWWVPAVILSVQKRVRGCFFKKIRMAEPRTRDQKRHDSAVPCHWVAVDHLIPPYATCAIICHVVNHDIIIKKRFLPRALKCFPCTRQNTSNARLILSSSHPLPQSTPFFWRRTTGGQPGASAPISQPRELACHHWPAAPFF